MKRVGNAGVLLRHKYLSLLVAGALSTFVGCQDSGTMIEPLDIEQISMTPQSATLEVGDTVVFHTLARFTDGSAREVPAVYTATGGWVRSDGLYVGTVTGVYSVVASAYGYTMAGSVTVLPATDPITLSRLVLTPDTAHLPTGGSAQFSAIGVFSNDSTISITPQYTTSGGSITPAGWFTAGSVAGTFPVVARLNNVADTSWVVISSPTPAPVASILVAPLNSSLSVGGQVQLTAVTLDGVGNVLTGRVVTWSSSNSAVATVTASGLVTATGNGGAIITASAEGVSGSGQITVTSPTPPPPPAPVASVTVTPGNSALQVGGTVQLTATLRDAANNVLTGRAVTWVSSDSTVAAVTASGLATARAVGTATITATSEGKSGTAQITISTGSPPPPAPVATVTVAPTTSSLLIGGTAQLTATTRDASNNVLTGRTIAWSSSNTAIATVNASGLVSAIAAGTVTITATSEGKSGTAQVAVSAPPPVPVATVAVSPSSNSLQVGSSVQLTATTRDANNNALTGRTVTWSSSNTAVATVNASGLVTAIAAGSATITATSEGKNGVAQVVVAAPPPPPAPVATVSVSPSSNSLQVGATVQLTATTRDANNNVLTGRTVSWTSSNSSVATVNANGLVSAAAAGSATITASSEGKNGTAQISVTAPSPPPGGALCYAVSPGRCYYISLSGSDNNSGSYTAPFATFAKAHGAASAGDHIYYLAGVYTDDARQFINYNKALNGAAGQRITIMPYPGDRVIFDNQGRNGSLAYLGGEGAIVEGFEFRNSRYGGPTGAIQGWTEGIAIWGRYHHFRRNYVHDITGLASGNGGSLRIQDTSENEIYNNYFDRLSVGGTGPSHNVNHVIVMDGRDNQIYNNYFANSAAGCFLQKHVPRAGNQAEVFNNTFVNCAGGGSNVHGGLGYTVHHNLYINSTMRFDYSGAETLVMEYNTLYSDDQAVIVGIGQPNTLRRNIVYQTATSFDPGNGLYTMRINHYSADQYYQVGLAGDAYDYNCYFNPNMSVRFSYYGGSPSSTGGVYTLAQFKGLGKDTHSIEADPQFVNAASGDYHTRSGSQCSDRGVYASGSPGNPPLTPAAALGRTP